jgi:hypothetical protein
MSNATVKQARRQASRYYGSTARTTVTRAHSRGRDDLDGGLHLHSSSGQEPTHEATKSKPLSASPPLTADRVDKMHDQLEEIHAFTAMQLAECARWRRSKSTPSSARAGTSQSRPVVTPSMIRLAPSPLLTSHPRPCHGSGRDCAVNHRFAAKFARVAWARCPNITHRACDRSDITTSSRARLRIRTTSPPSAPPAMRRSCFALHGELGGRH